MVIKMGGNQTKILVIDDEPDVGDFLKHFLSGREYEVLTAYGFDEALAILEKTKFAFVILDLVMNGSSGSALAEIIDQKYPETKIIVITAYVREAIELERRVKVDACFIKPLGLEELYLKLSELQNV